MEKIIHDKVFDTFLSSAEIDSKVKLIAEAINADYEGLQPLFICVLNGAFMFASDLIKNLHFFPEITFVKFASYDGMASSGKIRQLIGLNEDLKDRDIVIIEDIIDSGLTMDHILKEIKSRNPKSLKVATLLFKPDSFKADFTIDYICFDIPNKFVVGYGMDYNGYGRNLPDIYEYKN
jgi:hypoxanthine phosphoribosyltransferase